MIHFYGISDALSVTEEYDGPIIYGMMKGRSGENKTVDQSSAD
jgi:hypothetical protein